MKWLMWLKWTAAAVIVLLVGGFLNFYLPSRDIVRIVGTDIIRREVGVSSENNEAALRDVRFINAAFVDGSPAVYRNEDTGLGWPPYFKFDSADLAAAADNHVSSPQAPTWMVITSYGWRSNLLSLYPNAVSMREANGSDETLIPWFNIVLLAVFFLLVLVLRRLILSLFGFVRS